jgi:CRISPR-associated protein Csx14
MPWEVVMDPTTPNICVATLGGQPQVITLALDLLRAQGMVMDEVIVVHLAPTTPRYGQALQRLYAEFADDQYAGQPCRFRPLPVQLRAQTIADLDNETAVNAVQTTFRRLFQQVKQQDAIIHLCPTGGRRLLGMLAFSAALFSFDEADRIWHVYSPDAIRKQMDGGALMHLPPTPEVQLFRIYVPTWGPVLPLPPESDTPTVVAWQQQMQATEQQDRCRQVWDALTLRQRDVLRAFADGLTPQEVAERLHIVLGTVNDHKTMILQECRNVWDLPPDERIDYHWLREQFALFF